jgi:hypothetical protein
MFLLDIFFAQPNKEESCEDAVIWGPGVPVVIRNRIVSVAVIVCYWDVLETKVIVRGRNLLPEVEISGIFMKSLPKPAN